VVSLNVTNASDSVWVDSLLYKLTVLNFPTYLLKTIFCYLDIPNVEASFQTATATCRMRAGIHQGGNNFPRPIQSVC
jgi:hypothetical protein